MNDYLRGSNIGQKFVIYDAERDSYVLLKWTNDGNILEIRYVEDAQDATFCNSMEEVAHDLKKAGIALTKSIKIIGIKISLTVTPDFITDYSHKIKKPEEMEFEPVPENSTIEKLKQEILKARFEIQHEQDKLILGQQIKSQEENIGQKEYDPYDISSNKFL